MISCVSQTWAGYVAVLQSGELSARFAFLLSLFLAAHPIIHPPCLEVDSP
jgi:hypothetical protein